MTFSYDRVWADVVAMARSNAVLLLTLAGVFIFLPAFALLLMLPVPNTKGDTSEQAAQLFLAYYQANAVWYLLVNIFGALGQIVILVLLLDRNRPTVAEAISGGARLFPGYFLASLISNLAIGLGLLLFVVPGLYVLGRLVVLGPVIADGSLSNPLKGLRQSWGRTQGAGWRIVGLVLLVGIVGWIATLAATSILTVLGSVLLPESLNPTAVAIFNALRGATLGLLIVLLSAGIFRQLPPSRGI